MSKAERGAINKFVEESEEEDETSGEEESDEETTAEKKVGFIMVNECICGHTSDEDTLFCDKCKKNFHLSCTRLPGYEITKYFKKHLYKRKFICESCTGKLHPKEVNMYEQKKKEKNDTQEIEKLKKEIEDHQKRTKTIQTTVERRERRIKELLQTITSMDNQIKKQEAENEKLKKLTQESNEVPRFRLETDSETIEDEEEEEEEEEPKINRKQIEKMFKNVNKKIEKLNENFEKLIEERQQRQQQQQQLPQQEQHRQQQHYGFRRRYNSDRYQNMVRCYNCSRIGHIARDCWYNRRNYYQRENNQRYRQEGRYQQQQHNNVYRTRGEYEQMRRAPPDEHQRREEDRYHVSPTTNDRGQRSYIPTYMINNNQSNVQELQRTTWQTRQPSEAPPRQRLAEPVQNSQMYDHQYA